MISYTARHYVGFRQVTISLPWDQMSTPDVKVSPVDSSGLCMFLGPDSFVKWEDLVSLTVACKGLEFSSFY